MTQENKLQCLFKDYFSLYTPSLPKGITLLEMFLNPSLKRGEMDFVFNLLCGEISPYLQEESTTEEKAEIFRMVLFDKLGFEITNLSNENQLSLKQVIRTRKTTTLFMGVLYLLLAQNFNTPAFLALYKGQPIVCFRKEYNFPSIFIEISKKGIFTLNSDITNNLQILSTKQIIRHLLSNLIYLYGKQNRSDKKQTVQNIIEQCL